MTLKLITGPATEPVTLAEARAQCRVDPDDTSEDSLLESLIAAAREQAEHILGRALITQTWERVIDAFPPVEIELGMPPVLTVESVKYLDEGGDLQTIDSANYVLDNDDNAQGWVLPVADYDWPDTYDGANAVRVRFTCGYGTASDVPASVKHWMLVRVASLYKHREETSGQAVNAIPESLTERLLDRFRVMVP